MSEEVKIALDVLETVKNCWADQIANDGQKISDYDAICQALECVKDYYNIQ